MAIGKEPGCRTSGPRGSLRRRARIGLGAAGAGLEFDAIRDVPKAP